MKKKKRWWKMIRPFVATRHPQERTMFARLNQQVRVATDHSELGNHEGPVAGPLHLGNAGVPYPFACLRRQARARVLTFPRTSSTGCLAQLRSTPDF